MYEDYFQNFLGYPGNMYQNPCGRLEENYIYDQCVHIQDTITWDMFLII